MLDADIAPISQQSPRDELRQVNIQRLLTILGIAALVTIVFDVQLAIGQGIEQAWISGGGILAALLLIPVVYVLVRRKSWDATGHLTLLGILLVYCANEIAWAGATVVFGIGGVLTLLLASRVVWARGLRRGLIASVLYLASVLLINVFRPLPRFPVDQLPMLQAFSPIIILAILASLLWLVVRLLISGTIRMRLLLAFLLVGVLPVIVVGSVSALLGWQTGERRAVEQLELVAAFKETQIDTWVGSLETGLSSAFADGNVSASVQSVLGASQAGQPANLGASRAWREDLQEQLGRWLDRTPQFDAFFVMDLEGVTLLSTQSAQQDTVYADQEFFARGLEGPGVAVLWRLAPFEQPQAVAIRPILSADGEPLGVFGGAAGLDSLDTLLMQRAGLGETGQAFLVGKDLVALTPVRSAEPGTLVRSVGATSVAQGHQNGSGRYTSYQGEEVVGVYRWLPDLQVGLVAEQDVAEIFPAVYTTFVVNLGFVLASALVAVLASILTTRSIANPLRALVDVATGISRGERSLVVTVQREDEIGALARSFNSMTFQLQELIENLEQRVAERTRALEQRALYRQSAAQVGRVATSILDVEQLMWQVISLIRTSFALYYVGLFLVDDSGEWAVLRAGTGDAGRRMLARGHRIRVGEGMIGWCVAHAQPRIALDVDQDSVRLATTELPATRSEAALPLRSRGRVFGALTVQSEQQAAFDTEVLTVLQTMADQVAVALDNARLFAESQASYQALSRAYGELSRDAWVEFLRSEPDLAFRSDERGVSRLGTEWESPPTVSSARQLGQDQQGRWPLEVPVRVRDHVIGFLSTYKPGDAGAWTDEETEFIEEFAARLGTALDNARLHQAAQRRTIRDRQLQEISMQMQAQVRVDAVLQTVISELAREMDVPDVFVQLNTSSRLSEQGPR
jgi:GAF domain-containing protein